MSEQNKTWNARIQQKKDSDENWSSKNPVLLLNELVIVEMESGDCRFKIGDGVHAYSDLPFADQLLRDEVESKVPKEEGKALSSNDFTDDLKNKLDGISIMKGATADADGTSGLVPPPAQGADSKFLRGDGAWASPPTPNKVTNASCADEVPWSGVSGKPSTFPPSPHDHDIADLTAGVLQVSRGGTSATDARGARWNLEVPTSRLDVTNSADQLLEAGFYRVFEQEGVPYAYSQMIVAYGGGDTIAQIDIPYDSGFGNPKIRFGNPPSVGGVGRWYGWYDILTSMKPVSIVEGGTGAASAADALNSLGAVPRVWLEQFVPWSGRASSGNISVVNGRLYNYLLFMGEPGAGEYATTLMVPSQSNGTFQLASNAAFLTLTLTPSGNDVVVSIDSSQYGGVLTYVFGGILTR